MLAEKWLPNKTQAAFRAGVLAPIMTTDSFGIIIPSDSIFEEMNFNIGASVSWQITKHFLIECGLDFRHMFSVIPSGSFNPWIGFGILF